MVELVKAGADVKRVRAYLERYAADLVSEFDELWSMRPSGVNHRFIRNGRPEAKGGLARGSCLTAPAYLEVSLEV